MIVIELKDGLVGQVATDLRNDNRVLVVDRDLEGVDEEDITDMGDGSKASISRYWADSLKPGSAKFLQDLFDRGN